MLKIKDNVDLKELEKLGYEDYIDCYVLWCETKNYYLDEIEQPQFNVLIYKNTREIKCYENDYSYIEDLFEADLVEKA